MTVAALIFDFDGLIFDTEGPDWATWCAVYREHGHTLPLAQWQQGIGTYGGFDPVAYLEELLGGPVERSTVEERHRAELMALCEQQPLLPGVLDLLEAAAAAGIRLGLASSSNRQWVGRWLEQHQLEHRFACIRTRDDVVHPKPAPDLYLSAAAGLGVPPADCVALEDSVNGMRAALAAGMRCIVIPTAVTATLDFSGAALRLASLAELPLAALLERLAAASEETSAA